jgi:hypothetical protein
MGEGFDQSTSYDEGNKYERESTRQINLQILGITLDDHSIETRTIDPGSVDAQPKDVKEIQRIIKQCNEEHRRWGFKDPRTLLTYPIWAEQLNDHRVIAIYRHPYQVCRHYSPRTPVGVWRALQTWVVYNRALLHYIHRLDDALLIEFERLVTTDVEMGRLDSFLEVSPTDVRRISQFRNRSTRGWIGAVDAMMGMVSPPSASSLWNELEACRAQQLQQSTESVESVRSNRIA